MRKTLAVFAVCAWVSACAGVRAESAGEILEAGEDEAARTPVKPAPPDSQPVLPEAGKPRPVPSDTKKLTVDEPDFKATAVFREIPKPKYDQSTRPGQAESPAPKKNKDWSVPKEEGSEGGEASAPAEQDDAPDKAAEDISPALAKAIAKDKKNKDLKDAVKLYQAVAAAEEENAPARYRLGLALMRNGELVLGVKELDTARTLKPGNPKYQCDFGLAALQIGWQERALEACRTAAYAVPVNARYQSALGDCHLAAGAYGDAAASYARAISLDKGRNAGYIYNLGVVCLRSRAYKKAVEAFDEAIRVRGDVAQYYCSRGLAHENLRNIRQAIADYQAAVKADKKCAYAHFLLAGAFSDVDDPTYTNRFEAVSHAEQAVKLTQYKNAQYIIGLARALRAARNYEQAVEVARKAVELDSREEYRRELAKMQALLKDGLP